MARFRNPLLTHGGVLGCLRVRLLRKRNRAPSGGRHSPASGVLTNSTCELRLLAGRVRLGTKSPREVVVSNSYIFNNGLTCSK